MVNIADSLYQITCSLMDEESSSGNTIYNTGLREADRSNGSVISQRINSGWEDEMCN